MLLVSPDFAYMMLTKLLMAYMADILTHTVMTPETYNVKEMSETLLNIGESIKIGNSVCTDETKEFIQELACKVDRMKLSDELVQMASKQPRC